MINAPQLLADLTRRLSVLEDDLRGRLDEVPDLKLSLQTEWQSARDAQRTAETFESWADQVITQAGVHWLLSCVFLRFIEDNNLVDRPWIGGTPDSGRLNLARDRHEAYFRAHPLETDREYLLACFREAGRLPGLHTFFDETHNPVFRLGISGDAAMALRSFWQQQDPNTGALLHDFTDPSWNTRFLGDLYQDLSEATRKRYALLQTPEFVEEFILDRTLTPAIREFGYQEIRMIDPTCGSGHFLLGGFHRMVDEWSRNEPNRNRRDIAQKALDSVAGVDLNPFAVAISRFRLLVAALKTSDVSLLSEAPDFSISVAIGDSLLHGKHFGLTATDDMFQSAEHFQNTGLAHVYVGEDLSEVQRILGRQYHAVVGNPPYIVVKDAALNAAYRRQYASCHMKYSLGAPFTERFFKLALTGRENQGAGFVGLITSNSFMKREFGSRLIESVLPRLDLTYVVDTSGAYIPGHGTPTVMLFGRHRSPVSDHVRSVMGIKGEPGTPTDPAHGLVWSSILTQIDRAGSESEFVSVADTERSVFGRHPWSIGGGGAADLKEFMKEGAPSVLEDFIALYRFTIQMENRTVTREIREMGVFGMTNADEVMFARQCDFNRQRVESEYTRPLVLGDAIRDWRLDSTGYALFPYKNGDVVLLSEAPNLAKWLWPCRTTLGNRATFGKSTYFEEGRPWWAWHQVALRRIENPPTITMSFVATNNHFVIDRGRSVFNRSAPVLKFSESMTENQQTGVVGLLNSSVACFWMQQTLHNKGGPGGGSSKDEKWHDFFEFSSTQLLTFPVTESLPIEVSVRLNELAKQITEKTPAAILAAVGSQSIQSCLEAAKREYDALRRQMIATQEELDWQCYRLFGLMSSPIESSTPPEICLGERAFEIVMARRMASGTLQTRWFEWLGIPPVTEIPLRWPVDYRVLVQSRIDLIESDRSIALIESPNCKRRWETKAWGDQEQVALRDWLLARLEAPEYWSVSTDQPPQLMSASRLADVARSDTEFLEVARQYSGHIDFNLDQLVTELLVSESVPFLPVLRYTDIGLRKRLQWENTWILQRLEDAGEGVGSIPVPPKYKSVDFLSADIWRLRGGLDVPKERWIRYPGCERGADGSLVIAWAGWDHLQQATAIASYYLEMKDSEGWSPERLQPLLAGIQELLPWLKQWHNDLHPAFGERMGNYYEGFVAEEARTLGFTLEGLRAWRPATTVVTRRRRTASTSTNV
jgi:hypothetical protein